MATSRLLVSIEANSAKLVTEVERSRKSIQGMSADLKLIKFDSIVNLGERAFQAGRQFYDFAKSIASAANDIQRNAKTLNMSTAEYQQWIYVAKMADIQTEDLINGIKFLTKSMSETLQGTGDASKAFGVLGINIKDASGKTKDQQTVMFETIGALGKFADGVNRDALMLAIFGRSWMTIKPLIDAGTGAIQDWQKEAVKMGTVIGDVMLEKGSQAETQFKQLEAQINATKITFAPMALEFAKALNSMLDGLKQFFGYVEDQSTKDYWGKGWIGKALGLKGPIGEGLGKTPSMELPGLATSHGAGYTSTYKGGKPEAPGIGSAEDQVTTIKEEREQYEKEYWDDQHQRWEIETKDLDESSKAWGIYADEKIANLRGLNELDNQSLKEEVDRREYANQKILEGQEEFNKEFTEAWDAANQMYVDIEKRRVEESGEFMKQFSSNLSSSLTSNLTGMIKGAKTFKDAMKNIADSLADSFISAFAKIAINWALTQLKMTGESGGGTNWGSIVGSVVGAVGGLLGSGTGGAPMGAENWSAGAQNSMTWLQEGGIVNKPMIAGVGDVPEAVIPLDKLEGSSKKEDQPPNVTNFNIMTLDVSTMEQWVRKNSKLFVDVNVDNIRRGGQLAKAVRGA